MKYLLLCFIFASCAHRTKDDLVSVNAATNHAHASYLKGCVDAFHFLKIPKVFSHCREEAKKHRTELESFMEQDIKN